jgi:hypothetical protein
MVAMLEDQELSSALDIDHHSLPAFHPQNRRHRSERGRQIKNPGAALGGSSSYVANSEMTGSAS